MISYVKKDSDTAPEVKAKDDTVQTVPFTRKASVNLVTKEVTYTDWESPNKTWDKVGVDVLPGYIADKKEIPAKEAVTPAKDTKVILMKLISKRIRRLEVGFQLIQQQVEMEIQFHSLMIQTIQRKQEKLLKLYLIKTAILRKMEMEHH